jgi:hypothetical protein
MANLPARFRGRFSEKAAIDQAQWEHDVAGRTARVLLICGAARNDKTCPGEMSKSFRMLEIARSDLEAKDLEVDVLDLSILASEYGRTIYPCKGCVSSAIHGDSAGTEVLRRSLCDWLNDMDLIQAGEVRNAALALCRHVEQRRHGLQPPDDDLEEPRAQ